MPYQLAQYWDKGLRELHHTRTAQHRHTKEEPSVGHVPRDLRTTAKRTPAVKSWLRVLEEPVRQFVVERGLAVAADHTGAGGESSDETDPEDEEIVFVGRGGAMRDGKPWKRAERKVGGEEGRERGMVMDGMEEGEGGAFKCVFFSSLIIFSFFSIFSPLPSTDTDPRRWLTHSISDYYGLDSKSVLVGTPARRVIYVGARQPTPKQKQKQKQASAARHALSSRPVLPPPLWDMF